MRMLARQLAADLPRRIVEADLVVPLPLDFLRLRAGQVTVARQRAVWLKVAGMLGVGQHTHHDEPVRIAADMADQHLHADARQGIRAKARPGERAGDSHRRAVGRRAARAGALRMRVIVRVQPGSAPGCGPFHRRTLLPRRVRRRRPSSDAQPAGRHGDRRPGSAARRAARERVLVAPVVFIAWLAVHVGRHRVEQHAACREQRLCALVQFLRQVVPYTVMKRRDDELPLLGRQCVELRMLGKRKPMADSGSRTLLTPSTDSARSSCASMRSLPIRSRSADEFPRAEYR